MVLNVVSINIRGLLDKNKVKKKIELILTYIHKYNASIILVQEWGVSVRNSRYQKLEHTFPAIPNFTPYYYNYETAILVKTNLTRNVTEMVTDYHQRNWLNKNSFQFAAINYNDITLFSLYRSPSGKLDTNSLEEIINLCNDNFIGGGDINIKHTKWGIGCFWTDIVVHHLVSF